ncbi:MAG: cation transporter, partial [Oscillospiraceae bacterium]|nr:cation transporter [Oscillospiraceae bacterium]
DCANCAAKMEDLIRKIPGVHEANMNFMTQKLCLDAEDERFDEILAEAQKCCNRVDKGCRIVTN